MMPSLNTEVASQWLDPWFLRHTFYCRSNAFKTVCIPELHFALIAQTRSPAHRCILSNLLQKGQNGIQCFVCLRINLSQQEHSMCTPHILVAWEITTIPILKKTANAIPVYATHTVLLLCYEEQSLQLYGYFNLKWRAKEAHEFITHVQQHWQSDPEYFYSVW